MTKIFTKTIIIFVFITALFAVNSAAYAVTAPTCTLSISPAIIKKGEDANRYLKVTGPVDKVVYTVDGILKYTGGSVYDISSFPSDSSNYKDRDGYITGPTKIRPMSIGIGSETIYVYGPGGSNSCTASIKVVANELYDESKTVILVSPVTYHLGGSEKFRACPAFSCGTTVWGTTNGNATITKKNGDWYFASIVEEYVKGFPYNTSGWLTSDLVPNNIKEKLRNQNPSAFGKEEKSAPSTIQEQSSGTIPSSWNFFAPLKQLFNKKEIASPILTLLLLGLLYLAYRLFSKIKLPSLTIGIRSIKISRTQFVIGAVILGFISFGWLAFTLYQQTQNTLKMASSELAKTQQEIQSLRTSQEKTFAKQQSLLEQQGSQLQQSHANENATKQALQELQNRPAQTNGTRPTGAFLTRFSQSVVKMLCFNNSYSGDLKQGTGVLYRTENQSELAPFYVQTNLHVVETDDNSISSCIIVLYPDYANGDRYLIFKSTGYRFFKNYIDTALVKVEAI
ncbi:hypothetical protein EXS45_02170, partial [Candidatus Nomurabacteria bacterium]|nr:hypothetical protein [Candidatus Nomurabacteria bacterium]